MEKAICFGAGDGGKRLLEDIEKKYEVIAFTDNDNKKWGGVICELPVIEPTLIDKYKYDFIVITSMPGLDSIRHQLFSMGISNHKIDDSFVIGPVKSRITFLERLASIQKQNAYSVAEAGVFEGDFAKEINRIYKNNQLFLFDTFEGFDQRDIIKEKDFSNAKIGDYSRTSVELVMSKMPYPEKISIKKGYFPDTAKGIKEKFIFVNLDLDLYEPTYQGLLFFEDKMVSGGVILVHDYFARQFKGPKKAVDLFMSTQNRGLALCPIGDGISIAIVGW